MKLALGIALALSLLFNSCTDAPQDLIPMQEIKGRDYSGKRFAVYRARIPVDWIRKDTLPEESLADTTKSLCEFIIPGEEGVIRIAVHNFASETLDQRIPPGAQVARWQRQFEVLIPSESSTTPQAFSGYSGLKFKGVGTLNKIATVVLGWSLQLSNEHYRMLSHPQKTADNDIYREMRADVTIKAVGPKNLMDQHEEEIIGFARSFELIEEIPSRS